MILCIEYKNVMQEWNEYEKFYQKYQNKTKIETKLFLVNSMKTDLTIYIFIR